MLDNFEKLGIGVDDRDVPVKFGANTEMRRDALAPPPKHHDSWSTFHRLAVRL